jgi:hypothetical protein
MYLDISLTWARHIKTKRNQVNIKRGTNALDFRKINTVNRKQTRSIQSSSQTHLDLMAISYGVSLKFQHRNPPALPIHDSPIRSELTLVHNHEDLQMSTVLSEIKKLSAKQLGKLENHDNALAVTLLNSENVHRLYQTDLSKTTSTSMTMITK